MARLCPRRFGPRRSPGVLARRCTRLDIWHSRTKRCQGRDCLPGCNSLPSSPEHSRCSLLHTCSRLRTHLPRNHQVFARSKPHACLCRRGQRRPIRNLGFLRNHPKHKEVARLQNSLPVPRYISHGRCTLPHQRKRRSSRLGHKTRHGSPVLSRKSRHFAPRSLAAARRLGLHA